MKIVAHQMQVVAGDVPANTAEILRRLATSTQADLCIFPEAASSGFDYERLDEIARANVQCLELAAEACREHRRAMVLPLLVRDEAGTFVNRQSVLDSAGQVIATYDKVHLIGVLNEDRYLRPGQTLSTFQLNDGGPRIGLATCYDLRFPELFRRLCVEEGAEVLILPAMWPRSRATHFRALPPARAIENQASFVTTNSVGVCGNMDLCGGSAAYDHQGALMHEASAEQAESFSITIDVKKIRQWRKDFPALGDARLLRGDQPARQ